MENEKVQSEQNVQSAETITVGANETKKEFSIEEALRFGWEVFKKNAVFLVLLGLTYLGIAILEEVFRAAVAKNGALSFLINLAAIILNIVIGIGIVQIFLKLAHGDTSKVGEIIGDVKYFWKYLGASILFMLVVLFGFLLLIVPGVIWSVKYGMFKYFVIDKNMGPLEALKESGRITYGNKGKLFLFGLLSGMMMLAGLLLAGVGALVIFPVISLASVYIYKKLTGEEIIISA